jgi:hypothetical protein
LAVAVGGRAEPLDSLKAVAIFISAKQQNEVAADAKKISHAASLKMNSIVDPINVILRRKKDV